jgi:hypothetical protein
MAGYGCMGRPARRAPLCLAGGWGNRVGFDGRQVRHQTLNTLSRKGWVQGWSYGQAAVCGGTLLQGGSRRHGILQGAWWRHALPGRGLPHWCC